ncbi:hypothetical protein OTK49_21300 [Vibrio coralliirubri]|uniref:hypothetical protein n=1 Tax=Vibrio coralliirubri TaxID=1516159 RepID=UPI002283B95B|nr:hypothetical protein [Vibrio coralliirubri]MCY9865058.1 hypothetical protein [Vibrio coralliirubri]
MRFLTQLIKGVVAFWLFSTTIWAFGDLIGVDNTPKLIFFSYLSGIILVYVTFKAIVLHGTQYKMVYAPSTPLMTVNLALASILFCTIIGAAMLLTGKAIYTEGFSVYLSYLFLPPMYMCFVPTLLLRWKASDGEKMTTEFALIAKPFGFELAKK